MKRFCSILLLIGLVSCKTKSVVMQTKAPDNKLTSEQVIANHYAIKQNFSTLYIKASAHYQDENLSQNVTAEIRIKKDEVISISIRFLGITMAKALITPQKVQYYDKLNGKYFDGEYTSLSQWLGSDLNFTKIQNLLLGEALDDLTKEQYSLSTENNLYKLENSVAEKNNKTYFLIPDKYFITKEIIQQLITNRTLMVSYSNSKEFSEGNFPNSLAIEVNQQNRQTTISIDYNTISFNEELTFPYNVPEGYERIQIN